MNLRKKLVTILGGLALLTIVNAGVTAWATYQWKETKDQLGDHYLRSLFVQRIRADTFRAFKELGDALAVDDDDASQEFEESLKTVEQDFRLWASLAHNDDEKRQVKQIRNIYDRLVQEARSFFILVEAGLIQEANVLIEDKLEDEHFPVFEQLTKEAVASDRRYRQVVNARVQNTRQTAQLVLLLACFGIISLIFLFAAYFSSDFLIPIREIKKAIADASRGDLLNRLNEERTDEIGEINRAFNQMVETIQKREQMIQLTGVPTSDANEQPEEAVDWQKLPSKLMLHQLISQLRSRVTELGQEIKAEQTTQELEEKSTLPSSDNGAVSVAQKQQLLSDLDGLLQTISRITQLGFPLDLNLGRTDLKALLYEILLRFHQELLRGGVSFELDIAPDVPEVMVDRLKLREAIGELVLNAIDALPEEGGRLGIRASLSDQSNELLIEVADNGKGIERFSLEEAFTSVDSKRNRFQVGLKLTRAIIEQHGGRLLVNTNPGEGTYVQMRLPLRE